MSPIIIGIVATILMYLYQWWKVEEEHKNNPTLEKKKINYIVPCVVGVIAWFLSGCYYDSRGMSIYSDSSSELVAKSNAGTQTSSIIPKSAGSESYHLIGKKSVRLPSTDVFIDLAKF